MASKLTTVFCKNLFAGKVAIVTGGGTGLGKAITKELAELGCNVVIASRTLEKLQEAAQEINHYVSGKNQSSSKPLPNTQVYPFQCNIRQESQVEALMEYTVEKHGRIDYLVNNGGGQFYSPIAYMSTKGWNAVLDTNLNGTYYCTKHVGTPATHLLDNLQMTSLGPSCTLSMTTMGGVGPVMYSPNGENEPL